MKTEKMIMLTGKQYQEIKRGLENEGTYAYNAGSGNHPELLNITDIYLDTDPEFTRNPQQYAKVSDNMHVQVKIEYETD